MPVGAEVLGKKGVHFRVWAPRSKTVSVQPGRDSGGANSNASIAELEPEGDGYFSGRVAAARPGMLYKFRLDSGAFPDPASRFQPDGPHGPSAIVDPQRFKWTDAEWAGGARVVGIVDETMQPQAVTLWLRPLKTSRQESDGSPTGNPRSFW